MSLRGFSGFEAMFRKKMATAAPKDVLVKKKMSEGLTKEEEGEYRETFDKFDADGSGSIDAMELGKLIRVLGLNPSDAEVDTLKKEIDEDDSGDIDFQEFLELMNSTTLRNMQAVDDRESRLRTALQKLEGQDGRIAREDLVRMVTTRGAMLLSGDEAEDLCNRVKPGKDGRYKKDDFIKVLTR